MADNLMKDLLSGRDSSCWKEAIRLHNSGLKNGPLNRKYIHLDRGTHEQASATTLISTAYASYTKLNKKRSKFAELLIEIWHTVNRHAKAIDVFIQCDPQVSSIVWGSVRILLQIAEEEERASRIAGEGILEILSHVGRWEEAAAVSRALKSSAVYKAIVTLYKDVLDFLSSSTGWLRKGKLKRLGVSILGRKGDKFEGKLKSLRAASELVDREIQTRATYQNLDSLQNITLDVRGTMTKVDEVMFYIQQLSDNTTFLRHQVTSTGGNVPLLSDMLAELQTIPTSIANKVMSGIQGTRSQPHLTFTPKLTAPDETDIAKVKTWLAKGDTKLPPPILPAEGTCKWILEHPYFQTWTENEEGCLLWIQGLPGRGKSVMSGFLHRRLLCSDRRTIFHQFHHSASTGTQSTPASAVSSLLSEILDITPDAETLGIIGDLVKLTEQIPMGPQYCQFQPLWAIVESILTTNPGWTLILDAFDECTADGVSPPEPVGFLYLLRVLVQKTRTKILILSRHDSRFDTVIGPLPSIYLEDKLLLHDIMIFAQAEHDRLDLPESDRILVMERVRSSSKGSFWWVKLFLDYLSRALHQSEFHARLYSLAPSIKGFYEEILLHPKPSLDKEEIDCRNHIFLLDFQARRTLTVDEIGDALYLRPDRARQIIFRLCKPLVSTRGGLFQLSHPSVLEYFESYQRTSETYLGFSFSDSHAILAERCLSCLLRKDYACLELAVLSLRASFEETDRFQDHAGPAGFYNYASRYWHYHLTQVKFPEAEIIQKIDEFLHSINFVFWIHYCDSQFGRRMGVVGPLERVKSWRAQLSTNALSKVQIDNCYTLSYLKLISALSSSKTSSIGLLLAEMSLYDHHLDLGSFQEDSANRDRVVSQLDDLLGSQSPIVLRVKASIAYTRLLQGRMRAARRIYSELAESQRELVGKDDVRFVGATHYRGEGEYYMSEFATAAITFTATSAGFLKIFGPDRWSYLAAQLWYASAMAHLSYLDTALKLVQSLFEKRLEDFGSHDSLTVTFQIGLADLLRATGDHAQAIKHLREIVSMRRESCDLTDIYRLDVEILLARTLQEAGLSEEARVLVQELEDEGSSTRYERNCQVVHLKGLLSASDKDTNKAIYILQDIVIQAEQDQNNRALMWIRLDLADMLRLRNEEGDTDQASSLFDNLVKDLSGDCEPGFPDEPDPPRLLAAAEKALRLTRNLRHTEARRLLDQEHLDWLRPSDLWLWVSEVIFI